MRRRLLAKAAEPDVPAGAGVARARTGGALHTDSGSVRPASAKPRARS